MIQAERESGRDPASALGLHEIIDAEISQCSVRLQDGSIGWTE